MSGNTRDWVRYRPPASPSLDAPRYPLAPIPARWTILRPIHHWLRLLAFGGVLLIPLNPLYFQVTNRYNGFFLPISLGTVAFALVLLYTIAVLIYRLVAVRDLASPGPLRHVLGYIQVHRHVMADCFVIDAPPLPAVESLRPTRLDTALATILLVPATLLVTVNAFLLWTVWLAVALFALLTGRLPHWWQSLASSALDLLTIILVFAFTGARTTGAHLRHPTPSDSPN